MTWKAMKGKKLIHLHYLTEKLTVGIKKLDVDLCTDLSKKYL